MAKPKSDKAGALDKSPSHLLHRVLQRALDLYAAAAGPQAPTQRQYAVLTAVAAEEGVTQTGLVRVTGIDRSTLAELVSRMIAKGLLARERSALDARANAVRLTDAGRAALDAARPAAAAADAALLKFLPSSKRSAFVAALVRIAADEPRKPKKSAKGERKRKKAGRKDGKKKTVKAEASPEATAA